MTQNNVKILISCHKPSDVLRTEVFQPIQVGCTGKQELFPDMLHDNEGENISVKNPMYCELTAQYWAWKNLDLDYYGFCHYRRYFNLSQKEYIEDTYGNILESYLDDQTVQKYCLNDNRVRELTQQYDVIVTERKDLRNMPEHYTSTRQHYQNAPKLHMKDYDLMLQIIDEKYPQYSDAAHHFAEGSVSCFCNMYILRKDLFFEYCEWMFAVLDEFCKRTDMKRYSTEALRTPGHLSERLFNIYLIDLLKKHPELRVKEVQCVAILNTDPQEIELKPAFQKNSIPVVFAANDAFAPVFATCFRSLLDHVSSQYRYDVVLIESNLTKENQKKLLSMTHGIDNVSLRFYDPGRLIHGYDLKANAHISVETYYRFLIQSILPDYDKVLYLDCDTIINADVADLYETDVDGYMLAAARDPDFLGQINGANKYTRKYCIDTFHMKNPYHYFQAGILLFNEKEMRRAHSIDEWLTYASHPYQYNDQDVLNLYCEGRVKYIGMEWNMITDCNHERVRNVIAFAPDDVQKEYQSAHVAPKIIHYAGFMKPWYCPTEDYGQAFWDTARRTPFYEVLVYNMAQRMIDHAAPHTTPRKDESLHLKVINTVMPIGTKRREVLDGLYVRLSVRNK